MGKHLTSQKRGRQVATIFSQRTNTNVGKDKGSQGQKTCQEAYVSTGCLGLTVWGFKGLLASQML